MSEVDQKSRLAELELRAEAREKRRADQALARRIAELELDEKITEAFDAAEEKHGAGRVAVVRLEQVFAIVKKPHKVTFDKFTSKPENLSNTQALENFVKPCMVSPDWSGFEKLREEYPAFLAVAASKCVELGQGVQQDFEGK